MSFPRYPKYKDSGVEWLGEVPEHWSVKRLRFAAELNPSRVETAALDRDTDVTFLPMEAIGTDGTVNLETVRPLTEVETGYSFFRDGDVAFAKITPCFENGKGARFGGLRNGIGFGTTELTVLRPRPTQVTGPFVYYLTSSPVFRSLGTAQMYGAGGQKRVPESFARGFETAFPPVSEQESIARFLDREATKIDALVAEQQGLIEVLQEKRQAVISHAVTKGLNPDAPMKPSGVEWIGEAPSGWSVERLKSCSSYVTSGPRGWSEFIGDTGALFIQSGDLNDCMGIAFSDAQRVSVTESAETARTRLQDGDVVVCITGANTGRVGVCGAIPEPAYVNQHLCLIRPTERVLPRYLGLCLASHVGQAHFSVSQYGLKQGLSLEDVKATQLVLPPLREQASILARLDSSLDGVASLAREVGRAITLLQERRSALISAAVTGQIDVRQFAAEALDS